MIIPTWVYYFAQAVVTKYYKLSGLSNRNELAHSHASYKPQIKVLAGCSFPLARRENLFPAPLCTSDGLLALWHALAHRSTTLISAAFSTWHSPWVLVCVHSSPFYKDPSHAQSGAHLHYSMTSS